MQALGITLTDPISCCVAASLFAVLGAIVYLDWRTRTIPNILVLALVALRLVLLLDALVSEGIRALEPFGTSALLAVVITAICLAAKAIADRQARSETLGMGDIKLTAAQCLYLTLDQAIVYLVVSAVVALVLALYFKKVHNDRTFPFAPALVAGFLVAFIF